MFCRCLLLVLVCLQTCTAAENGSGPALCCFSYQRHRIPVKLIAGYTRTEQQCFKPGVIFTLQSGRHVCADPGVEWVKNHMEKLNQRLIR